ncbi:MAG TPA: ABC transporter ATP-binding protein [Thermomicrobiales bacterium]|nr:ABC transporter ATP-binding protein [Thermomicrobiales bacterium]
MSEPVSGESGAPVGPGPPSVELTSVYKDYGTTRAVDGVSLQVQQGEFLTLLGPSGCGKTTTLRMIGGFEFPTAGSVAINGEIMGNRPPYRRPVNTVFQNYALFPHMTVGQNVGYGLEMAGVPKTERQRRVGEALELVRLPQVEHRKPAQLSGGQQQRIALARALINRPQVLLLDEPLGALDLKLRKAMQLELKGLNREVGITFVYVTHDQDEALTMSDRIAVMNAGKILQLGDPREIYEHPRSRFVADFIGETNMLSGALERIEGEIATIAISGVGEIRVPAGRDRTSAISGELADVIIRPERMTLHHLADLLEERDGENRLDGAIADAIYLGTHTQYLVRFADGQTATVHVQNSGGREDDFMVGDPASVGFPIESAALLDER